MYKIAFQRKANLQHLFTKRVILGEKPDSSPA